MPKVKNFSENLENSLVRLGHEASRRMESPEGKVLSEREALKQSIRSLALKEEGEGEAPPVEVSAVPPAPSSVPTSAPSGDFMPSYLSGGSESAKKAVDDLLQIAVGENIERAVSEAKKYPPFVEDAFHDALVDKFLPELKKRGIIK